MRARIRHHAGLTPTFAAVLTFGLLLALLPRSLTGPVKVLVQPLEWIRWGTSAGLEKARKAAGGGGEKQPTAAEYRALEEEKQRLERLVGHQSLQLEELSRRVEEMSSLKEQLGDSSATLVFASVIAPDSSRSRKSLVIDRGTEHGVAVGQWVASGMSFEQREPGQGGRALVARQALIGVVAEAHSYSSRVQLATDVGFHTQAQVVRRLADGTLTSDDQLCWLEGVGGGRMVIRESRVNYFDAATPSFVVIPRSATLPGRFMIGRLVKATPVETAPLNFNLTAEPLVDIDGLSHVLVIVSGR